VASPDDLHTLAADRGIRVRRADIATDAVWLPDRSLILLRRGLEPDDVPAAIGQLAAAARPPASTERQPRRARFCTGRCAAIAAPAAALALLIGAAIADRHGV
jgi:hypothetical protein